MSDYLNQYSKKVGQAVKSPTIGELVTKQAIIRLTESFESLCSFMHENITDGAAKHRFVYTVTDEEFISYCKTAVWLEVERHQKPKNKAYHGYSDYLKEYHLPTMLYVGLDLIGPTKDNSINADIRAVLEIDESELLPVEKMNAINVYLTKCFSHNIELHKGLPLTPGMVEFMTLNRDESYFKTHLEIHPVIQLFGALFDVELDLTDIVVQRLQGSTISSMQHSMRNLIVGNNE